MEKIKKIIRIVILLFKINWIKTLYLNFKTQRFAIALKLPIIVFGKMKIYSLRGNIVLNFKATFGSILFGKDVDHFPASSLPIKLLVNNKIVFNGNSIISGGCTLTSWDGSIEIGRNTIFGSGTVIKSQKSIKIGEYCSIAANCIIMDTNVHFVISNDNNTIQNIYDDIVIGKNCWINTGTSVAKGSVIPDYSITARNSFTNKDYSSYGNVGLLLIGSPATIKTTNLQTVWNFPEEMKLKKYFIAHPNQKFVNISLLSDDLFFNKSESNFESIYKLY